MYLVIYCWIAVMLTASNVECATLEPVDQMYPNTFKKIGLAERWPGAQVARLDLECFLYSSTWPKEVDPSKNTDYRHLSHLQVGYNFYHRPAWDAGLQFTAIGDRWTNRSVDTPSSLLKLCKWNAIGGLYAKRLVWNGNFLIEAGGFLRAERGRHADLNFLPFGGPTIPIVHFGMGHQWFQLNVQFQIPELCSPVVYWNPNSTIISIQNYYDDRVSERETELNQNAKREEKAKSEVKKAQDAGNQKTNPDETDANTNASRSKKLVLSDTEKTRIKASYIQRYRAECGSGLGGKTAIAELAEKNGLPCFALKDSMQMRFEFFGLPWPWIKPVFGLHWVANDGKQALEGCDGWLFQFQQKHPTHSLIGSHVRLDGYGGLVGKLFGGALQLEGRYHCSTYGQREGWVFKLRFCPMFPKKAHNQWIRITDSLSDRKSGGVRLLSGICDLQERVYNQTSAKSGQQGATI